MSAATLIQKIIRSAIDGFFLWSTLSKAKAEGSNKREVQRGTLAPRSALGEHTLYGTCEVKYSVLYFTYHGEKNFREVVKQMSKCAVHMMKMKMGAMGGIQSHNQREHESKKNKEIDYSKSEQNYDVLLDERINYQRAVKERIAELNLKRAVRADAVVYSSFIVSSDREFFYGLGYDEHIRKSNEVESVALGLTPITEFEYCSEEYKSQCIAEGSRRFFEDATEFFCDRYGKENVINATVHMDEATPHMHIGVVPVTKDGRLSAKTLFTPLELKQLQTDFARLVGAKYGLERGVEGSEATHLDEVTFKLKQRTEQVEALEEQVQKLNREKSELERDNANLSKSVENALERVKNLTEQNNTLEDKISVLEAKKDALEADEQVLVTKFLEQPQVKSLFERFKELWQAEMERRKEKREERQATRQEKRESVLGSLAYYEQKIAERKQQGGSGLFGERQNNKTKTDRGRDDR